MTLYTVSEVAERLSCSIQNVYGLLEKKELGCVRIGANGGGYRVSEVQLDAFIESRREHPGKDAPSWPASSKPRPKLNFKR